MKMSLTRMGVGSKVVVTGDVTQVDLPERPAAQDALHKGLTALRRFTRPVRHRLVQQIVKVYERAAQPPAGPAGCRNGKCVTDRV